MRTRAPPSQRHLGSGADADGQPAGYVAGPKNVNDEPSCASGASVGPSVQPVTGSMTRKPSAVSFAFSAAAKVVQSVGSWFHATTSVQSP